MTKCFLYDQYKFWVIWVLSSWVLGRVKLVQDTCKGLFYTYIFIFKFFFIP